MKYYLLLINARDGILNDIIANTELEYRMQGTLEVKRGDGILGYICQPIGEARMLFEATRDSEADKLYLKKILDIYNGVNAGEIEGIEEAIYRAEAALENVIEIDEDLYIKIRKRIFENIMTMSGEFIHDAIDIKEKEEIKLEKLPRREPRKNKIHSLNCIIYGPPGTGKTYSTAEYAQAIIEGIDLKEFKTKNTDRKVVMEKYNKLIDSKRIVFTTFHQNYGYEEFIQGLRPDTTSDKMAFKTVDGVFKQIADAAINDQDNNYVIIIDEINRANISKVFGELITLIEDDKRWGEVNQISATLQSGDLFAVPNNLYIVGTMNSADKSISLIDAALRRRFEFIGQKPDSSLVADPLLKDVLEKINEALVEQLDSTDLLIGHSYFMNRTEDDLPKILNNSVIPLLYEYFYDSKKKVVRVLNNAITADGYAIEDDKFGRIYLERQRIRNDS